MRISLQFLGTLKCLWNVSLFKNSFTYHCAFFLLFLVAAPQRYTTRTPKWCYFSHVYLCLEWFWYSRTNWNKTTQKWNNRKSGEPGKITEMLKCFHSRKSSESDPEFYNMQNNKNLKGKQTSSRLWQPAFSCPLLHDSNTEMKQFTIFFSFFFMPSSNGK